jgi:hypothetical protein
LDKNKISNRCWDTSCPFRAKYYREIIPIHKRILLKDKKFSQLCRKLFSKRISVGPTAELRVFSANPPIKSSIGNKTTANSKTV